MTTCSGAQPGGARGVQADGDEVGPLSGCDASGVRPAQRAVAVDGERVDQLGRAEPAALARRPAARAPRAAGPRRAGRSGRAGRCRGRAGDPASRSRRKAPTPSARSASVLGQAQTAVPLAPRVATSCAGQVGGVHRRGVRAEQSVVGEQARRACSRRRPRHAAFSAGCSERCTCSGRALAALGDRPQLVGGDGAHRVHGGADPQPRALGQQRHPRGPAVGVAVGEPAPGRRRAAGGRCPRGRRRGSRCRAGSVGCRRRRRPAISASDMALGSAYGRRRPGGAGSGTRRRR